MKLEIKYKKKPEMSICKIKHNATAQLNEQMKREI